MQDGSQRDGISFDLPRALIVATTILIATAADVSSTFAAGTLLAGGMHFTCGVRPDRTVACWGRNQKGQLGDGTTIDRSSPVTVAGLGDVTAPAAGRYHACAVLADGTVRCWGYNGSGQLGDGSTTTRTVSVPVSSMADGARTGAGDHHTCAMLSDASVYCWGANGYGQLGNGTHAGQSVPTAVFSFPREAEVLNVNAARRNRRIRPATSALVSHLLRSTSTR